MGTRDRSFISKLGKYCHFHIDLWPNNYITPANLLSIHFILYSYDRDQTCAMLLTIVAGNTFLDITPKSASTALKLQNGSAVSE